MTQFTPNLIENLSPPSLSPQEPRMAAPVALNVLPISTPLQELDHLPFAGKGFQIKDTSIKESPLTLYCRYRDHYLNHAEKIGLRELGFPKYQFHRVHIFPEIVHYCHINYSPSQRALMTRDHTVLFTITDEFVNEIL